MRITGGSWRSRALRAPKGQSTRPTSDRVREALFSMLTADGLFEGSPRVLDLYAGSGALAFEALSRGATEAVVVEKARDALVVIRENATALAADDRIRVTAGDVERIVTGTSLGTFGIIFLDPPYADVRTPAFVAVLAAAARLVEEGGALVLEHASSDPPPEIATMVLDRSRRHGDTTLSLYYRPSAKTE